MVSVEVAIRGAYTAYDILQDTCKMGCPFVLVLLLVLVLDAAVTRLDAAVTSTERSPQYFEDGINA